MSRRGRHARSRTGRRTRTTSGSTRRFRLGWIPALLAFAVALVLLVAGAAFAGYRYERAAASRILPGVRIAGVDVGGMTRAEALRALAPMKGSILDRTIVVRAGDRTWTATPGGLGTRV